MWSLFAAAALVAALPPLEIKVMTYNLRFATAQDGENAWPRRREALIALVKKHDPDVLGVQEALASQIDELRAALPGHDVLGAGRDDGLRAGEHAALFTRRDLLGLREGGTRWISDAPDTPGTIGPGARIPRVFSWGEFFVPGKRRVLVMNCHLDHESAEARQMGTTQMRAFAGFRPGLPALLIGDFNCGPDSKAVSILTEGARFAASLPKEGPFGTYNGFQADRTGGEMIDHVFASPEWEVVDVRIDHSLTPDGRPPSDHFPVIVRLRLIPGR